MPALFAIIFAFLVIVATVFAFDPIQSHSIFSY